MNISGLFSSGQGDIIFGFQFFRDLLEISERGQPHEVQPNIWIFFHKIFVVLNFPRGISEYFGWLVCVTFGVIYSFWIFWELFQEISVSFAPDPKFQEFRVGWKTPFVFCLRGKVKTLHCRFWTKNKPRYNQEANKNKQIEITWHYSSKVASKINLFESPN